MSTVTWKTVVCASMAIAIGALGALWASPSWAVLAARSLALQSGEGTITVGCSYCCKNDFMSFTDTVTGDGGPTRTDYCKISHSPVNYYTGEKLYSTTDLEVPAMGGIALTRSFVTRPMFVEPGLDMGWRFGPPRLVKDGTTLYYIHASRHAKSWADNGNGTFTPHFFYQEKLVLVTNQYSLPILRIYDLDGNQTDFWSFDSSIHPSLRGRVLSFASGATLQSVTNVGWYHEGYGSEYAYLYGRPNYYQIYDWVTAQSYYHYFYYDLNGKLTSSEIVQTGVGVLRTAEYHYYTSSGANGPAGALKRVDIYDNVAGNYIQSKYYRYDALDGSGRLPIRFIVEGPSYERLKAAAGGTHSGVESASDTTVTTYANSKLTFDSDMRVTQEEVQGIGTMTVSAPTWSAHADGISSWKSKVTETLPNGDQNIVYTNYVAQPILTVVKEFATGLEWRTWHQRDSAGRTTLLAHPSAVTGYDEAYPNLVDGDGGNLQYISDSSGLLEVTEYASSTTATTSMAGDASGFVKRRAIKEGENGSLSPQVDYKYIRNDYNFSSYWSETNYALAERTVYRNADGTGGQTTTFSHIFQDWPSQGRYGGKIASTTTTYPVVPTGQNGSNSATSEIQLFDHIGRPTWSKDAEGFIQVRRYHAQSGGLIQHIVDVNTTSTSDEPSGWTTPAGGGLHLTWNYVTDGYGRTTRSEDPNGQVTYTVYKDAALEVRVYPGWTGTATTGPIRVSRRDKAGSYVETLTTSVAAAHFGGAPTGGETLDGTTLTPTTLHSLERTLEDANRRVIHKDSYFSFSGLTYTTGITLGTLGTHFYRSKVGYDSRGRADRNEDWSGTITRKVFDRRSRVTSSWVGTDDTPNSGTWSPSNTAGTNLIKVSESIYDSGGVGDDLLTASRQYTSAVAYLETVYQYDYRRRQTVSRGPDGVASKMTYDNLGRVVMSETYADQSGPLTLLSSELRARGESKFDERGQVYQTIQHHVQQQSDASPGTVGDRLTTNTWYNARGMTIKTRDPNGLLSKSQYDGAGRMKASFTSYDDNSSEGDYTSAFDVSGDTVISQAVNDLDAGGRVIQVTQYQRTDSSAKTGDLSASWAVADSRRTFRATWFDAIDRETHSVDYGTNGDAAFTRPGTAPGVPSDDTTYTYLRRETQYHSESGRPYRSIDNKGRIAETTFDLMSRSTKTVQNYVDGVVGNSEYDTDRTTEITYDSFGRKTQVRYKNPKGASVEDQDTLYVYGTDANVASPAIYRNDLLVAEIYPDSDDTFNPAGAAGAKLGNGTDSTYDRVELTYDYAGRLATKKLQDTTVHSYIYDSAGRQSEDQATALGTNVDGAVRRIQKSFDDLSRPLTVGSYSATSGGTLLNEVRFTYDGWGSEVKCEQGHEGTATGAPSYTKAFSVGAVSGEAKYVRTTSLTYPNGRVVYRNFPASGVGDKLSRVDNLANDASGTVQYAQYTYLGAASLVKLTYPNPQLSGGLSLDLGTGTGSPSGWDRFGRVVDQKWVTGGAVVRDQYQYAYDRTGNRMFRDNLTASAKDQKWSADGLDRVTLDKRGDLNAGRTDITGTPVFQETWTLEGTGNWGSLVQASSGTTTLNQTRTHTKVNETGTIAASTGTNWGDVTVDQNGNMTKVPKPSALNQLYRLTFDAWGRVVQVVDDASPTTILGKYKFDGLNRRIVKLRPASGNRWNRMDYYYSCEWQVVEERELLNTTSQTTVATRPEFQYVWDSRYIDALVLRDENKDNDGDCVNGTDQRVFYTQDANMNVTGLILASTGAVAERVMYDAFGKHALFQSNWTTSQAATTYRNEVLFGGYRHNPETGLYNVRHRDYHPNLGRWVQRDPIGYHDGPNLYEYVRGNPPIGLDPQGLYRATLFDQYQQTCTAKGECAFSGTDRNGVEWVRSSSTDWNWERVSDGYRTDVGGIIATWGADWSSQWASWWEGGQDPAARPGAGVGPAQRKDPIKIAVVDVSDPKLNDGAPDGQGELGAFKAWAGNNPRRKVLSGRYEKANNHMWVNDLERMDWEKNNCILVLELSGHGSHRGIAGINPDNVEAVSQRLKNLPWCSSAGIFLTGCNTGLESKGMPVARYMAESIPDITVYGTRGLAYRARGELLGGMYVTKSHYADSVNESGEKSWNIFRTGVKTKVRGE